MKTVLPLLVFITFFVSCSTAYKTGQTPDDVYYSPERPRLAQNEYVQMDKENDRQYRGSRRNVYQDDYYTDNYYNDRYLRMMVRNRRTWSDLDFYYSDPYAYRYYNPNYFSNYWSPNSAWSSNSYWNYYYNPYCSHFYNPSYYANSYYGGSYGNVIIVNPKSPVYNRPRTANLQVYNSPQRTQGTRQQGYGNYKTGEAPVYSTPAPRRSSNTGDDLRSIFGSSNSSSSGNNSSVSPSRPASSSSNSSSSSSSGSSGSSSGGASRAPSRSF